MFKFGLRNLRRLGYVDPIEIRPINILVGRNSSGKSTFLRSFPLMAQSLQTRTSAPILWYGNYVDFGDFKGAVRDNDINRNIEFIFELDKLQIYIRNRFLANSSSDPIRAQITISLKETKLGTRINSIIVYLPEKKLKIDLSISEHGFFKSIRVNGEEYLDKFGDLEFLIFEDSLMPDVHTMENDKEREYRLDQTDIFLEPLMISVLKKDWASKRTLESSIKGAARVLLRLSKLSTNEIEIASDKQKNAGVRRLLDKIANDENRHVPEDIEKVYLINYFRDIVNSVFREIRSRVESTLYIGPARARSERYYRYQDLSVSDIDPDGKNLPIFLNSLSKSQKEIFSDWVKSRFNYGVEVISVEGHLSINLTSGERHVNIVDAGYGVSQILPVLGQLWWARNRPPVLGGRRLSSSSILLIEQPELHLHPAHQALLADALVDNTSGDRSPHQRDLRVVIETHSEALINRIGQLISDKKLSSDDVQVLIFEDIDEESNETGVSVSTFTDDGSLKNWPYGFFLPEY